MSAVPIISIFVRHGKGCAYYPGETTEQVKCRCKKHLRYMDPATGKPVRKATKARDWAGAKRVAQEVLATYTGGSAAQEDSGITLKEAIAQYVASKRGTEVTPEYGDRLELVLTRLQSYCEKNGATLLRQVTSPLLREYRATWKGDSSYGAGSTRAKIQSYIRGFFHDAVASGALKANPALGLTRIYVAHTQTLPLEPEEYTKLLDSIPAVFVDEQEQKVVHAHAQLMRYAGLAVQDAARLPRAALQFNDHKKIWRVVTKRRKTRHVNNAPPVYVPIPTAVAEELLALKSPDIEYFFLEPNSETATTVSQVVYFVQRYRALFKKAGLMRDDQRMVSHRLRDTFAVEMLKAGVPLEDVSKMLGHSTIVTTERSYAAWVKGRQDRLDTVVASTWQQPEVRA